jgi:hypothetical protein
MKQSEYEQALDQLFKVLSDLVAHAEKQATRRCPYKNRLNECVAKFGCRNQRKTSESDAFPACEGDDKLNYRLHR